MVRRFPLAPGLLAGANAGDLPPLRPAGAAPQTCQLLAPVGGDGVTNIITRTVSPGNPFSSTKLFFKAISSVSATHPVQAYLKFSDGSNLRVDDGRAVSGRLTNQANVMVGATSNMAATGFTYRISVQGCF
jgi:hypothetical protein